MNILFTLNIYIKYIFCHWLSSLNITAVITLINAGNRQIMRVIVKKKNLGLSLDVAKYRASRIYLVLETLNTLMAKQSRQQILGVSNSGKAFHHPGNCLQCRLLWVMASSALWLTIFGDQLVCKTKLTLRPSPTVHLKSNLCLLNAVSCRMSSFRLFIFMVTSKQESDSQRTAWPEKLSCLNKGYTLVSCLNLTFWR